MYFSVLPLLFLFASAICASPIHIQRRADGLPNPIIMVNSGHGPIGLLGGQKNNKVYRDWSARFKHSGEPVTGVPESLKITLESNLIAVRVQVADTGTAIADVRDLIPRLGKLLESWGWGDIETQNQVAVILVMRPEGEALVKRYLGSSDLAHAFSSFHA